MGENFIEKRLKSVKHGRDAAYDQELATPNLCTHGDPILEVVYPCRLNQGKTAVHPSERLIVRQSQDGMIEVIRGATVCGWIEGPAAEELFGIGKERHTPLLCAEVIDVDEAVRECNLRLVKLEGS
jgi:hypothetical protein